METKNIKGVNFPVFSIVNGVVMSISDANEYDFDPADRD